MKNRHFSDSGQHESEDLQAQILLISQSVRASLDDPNLVESLNEAERHLVFWLAIGRNPVPMTLDRRGKLLVGLQTLPLQAGFPALEEATCPAFALVVPQLPERLLEQVRGIQTSVRCEKRGDEKRVHASLVKREIVGREILASERVFV